MKSSATPLRALGRPGAVTAFCIVCVTCILIQPLKSQDRRADAKPAMPRKVLSPGHSDRPLGTRAAGYLGALPLAFEPNQGQSSDGVKYVARGARYNIFFTPAETVLVLGASSPTKTSGSPAISRVDILRMSLAGADTSAGLAYVRHHMG
jgi:hypothetical protein